MSKTLTKLTVKEFLQFESASGVMLLLSALAALVFANSPLSYFYGKILETPVAIQVGALAINKPLLLRINDGLMAIFFSSSAWKLNANSSKVNSLRCPKSYCPAWEHWAG